MLTLTETIDAINALDTDADIITGACKRILGFNASNTFERGDPREIATSIVDVIKRYNSKDALVGMSIAIATTAASQAKSGHEGEVLRGVLGEITQYFMQSVEHLFRQRLRDNPEQAIADLKAMMDKAVDVARNKT